ncbi:putative sensor-like histidine kinase [Fibrella aestuarina BUZ 2]|uniref:Putative sensor-like histidine kinase n=1 Tax=Fibrella aestuarina BUZ 2 TaxID=1166018 RepID=I0K1P5_9BACT|nr:histidine kinase [Fibrella aestuarina]CCG98048.1 putative sensor-like histidine kinase [Fibrella aestuarina BUZ 2]
MSRRIALILIHLLGCLLFLSLPYLFAENGFAKLAELPTNPHERRNLLSYGLTITFFYVNYYYLIPRLFFGRHYGLYAVSVVGSFLLVQTTLSIVNQQAGSPPRFDGAVRPMPPPDGHRGGPPPVSADGAAPPPGTAAPWPKARAQPPGLPSEINHTFFLFLAGLLLSLAIRINNRWRETERERIQTELRYLKAQINPHFLFNTLNSIYSLAIEQSPSTADAVVQLSSFLRYVITEGRQDRVALSHELAYIGHYIALQRLRMVDTVQVSYQAPTAVNGYQIAPLLLISFIENAFKYGVSPQEPSRIDVRIELATGGRLHLHVANQKVRVADPTAVGSGIGLSNTQARLQLLYPGRHELVIRDEPDTFAVELEMNLL